MDADIIIDGSPQLKGSPLLLRTLVPGEHRLEIRGISPRGSPVTFTLEQGEIRSIHFDYINNLLLTNYSTSSVLGIEERIDGYGYESRITYQVQDVKGMPIVYEEFPKQGTIDILNIAVPVFAVISGLLTLNDAAYPKDSGLFFSPVTITAYTVTAGLLGYRVALGRQRKKYIESLDVRPEELTASHLQARELYSRAQELLSGDELEEALLNYQQIVGNHAETIYMPHALYKIARIHQIEERYDVAEGTFELILERYPLADLYDKSLKALAELYAAQGRYCMGILYLDRMLFADPLFKRYAIQDYRQTLETECFSRGTEMARGDE
jgi:tetratricopeptide (TPR) repeat protein